MESIDLDINNYSVNDILNLFSLAHDFTKTDLTKAKKQVLKTHPDKSNLDEIFSFLHKKHISYCSKYMSLKTRRCKTISSIDIIFRR